MSGLGNLGELMDDKKGLSDLSWLELEPGKNYDNIPTGNLAEAIPQLEEAWEHGMDRNTNFIPNQVMDTSIGAKPVSPELIQEVANVAKKAMMSGMGNKEIISNLEDRFPVDTLKAASGELKKVASEQGLLGNVYIDLSAFDTCKQASQVLGKHRTRLASFAVGAPRNESNYLDSFGNCRELGKKVVASIDYTPEVLSKYESILKSAGKLSSDGKIETKEDLKTAFMASEVKSSSNTHRGAAPLVKINASEEDVAKAEKILAKEASKKEAAESLNRKIAASRPVVAKVQNAMLKGLLGDSLKEVVAKEISPTEVSKFASEIKNAISLQGLMGALYADVSLYSSVEAASDAVKMSATAPKYIMASYDNGDNRLNRVASATGCKVLSKEIGVEAKVASEIISSLVFSDKISSDQGFALEERIASGSNTISVVKEAFLATLEKPSEVRVGGIQATYNAPLAKQASSVDSSKVKLAATQALEAGIPVSEVESKVATLVAASEALGTVRNVLSSMKEVAAASLDKCATDKYPLHPEAKIVASTKCASCIHKASGMCVKQGSAFSGEVMIDALSNISSVGSRVASDSEQFKLSSGLDVDFSGVVDLPKTNIEGDYMDAASGMDSFLQ